MPQYANSKHKKIQKLPYLVKYVEKCWLNNYIIFDGRFLKLNLIALNGFFNFSNIKKLRTAILRSRCIFSRTSKSISRHTFWYSRYFLNVLFKTGRMPGYRKY